ncbi:hypothetical protein EZJ49_06200 [Bdellovibrio bacteriovorus]|uniref:hypothetical protein n=1 Tax=Bdellovibrio bacteriovorus TaxID=959 RepID=UPI0021D046B8|nr:hypothetical protein [Bdellovibrio bacteriovorus]UXR65838.1 hypothetical protein EZJ49_06200 [Bdellovibrio bacteriovorus]
MNILFYILALGFFASPQVEAAQCAVNQYWVKPHYRRAYVRSDGKHFAATNVKGYCKERSVIYDSWSGRFKSQMPTDWPHTKESFKDWKIDEKERVLEILEKAPEELLSKNIIGIYRADKSRQEPNPATSADGVVVIYDSAFKKPYDLQRVLYHELAHQMYIDLSDKDAEDYRWSTSWWPVRDRKNTYVSRSDGYVQDDGRDSPEEDYANNIEFYLVEPETLKKVTPNAYNWIKRRFGDKFKIRNGGKK